MEATVCGPLQARHRGTAEAADIRTAIERALANAVGSRRRAFSSTVEFGMRLSRTLQNSLASNLSVDLHLPLCTRARDLVQILRDNPDGRILLGSRHNSKQSEVLEEVIELDEMMKKSVPLRCR